MKKLITLVLALACISVSAGCTKKPHIPTGYDVDGVKMVYTNDGDVTSEAIDIYDEEIVSELFAMHNSLQAKATNKPMSDEVMEIHFWKGEVTLINWYISVFGEDGTNATIITRSNRLGNAKNYVIESDFDYHRIIELFSEAKAD